MSDSDAGEEARSRRSRSTSALGPLRVSLSSSAALCAGVRASGSTSTSWLSSERSSCGSVLARGCRGWWVGEAGEETRLIVP